MKRVLLAVFVLGVSTAMAQNVHETPKSADATRIAVVNVGYIFTKYELAIRLKAGIDEMLVEPKKEAQRILTQVRAWEAAIAQQDFGTSSKEEYEANLKKAKRQLEDMDADIKKRIGKKQEENLLILWKDVQQGIRVCAENRGIDVVFGYGDPMNEKDLNLFPNVNRKMQAMDHGSAVPLYARHGTDLAEEVTRYLNDRYRNKRRDNNQP